MVRGSEHDAVPSPQQTDWYKHAFGELYPVLYAHRTVEQAKAEAAFAVQALKINAHDRLLDLCCGAGRHLVYLAEACRYSAGLDYSPHLLARAHNEIPTLALVRGNMRAVPFRQAFDVVTNFFTSFGYFPSDEENALVAREIGAALRPRGRFLIDHINAEHVLAHLEASSVRRRAGYEIHEQRWYDAEAHRLNKTAKVYRDGAIVTELSESVRLYSPDEFTAMLRACGLETTVLYGGYNGENFGQQTGRMIAVGHKR